MTPHELANRLRLLADLVEALPAWAEVEALEDEVEALRARTDEHG